MAPNVPAVKLSNGYEMPIIGLGTWKSKPGEVEEAVKNAIEVGYRHIDCAMVYENEKEVGAAIKAKIDDGTVKREDLFVVSKLWNTFHQVDLVIPTCKKTIEDLGVGYLDLYLIHWPMAYKPGPAWNNRDENGKTIFDLNTDYLQVWHELEKAVDQGLVRSIGVSNFNSQQLDRLINNGRIKPVNNQVECHPYLNQKKLIAFCKERGICVTAYSPLGSPDRPWAKPDDPKLMEDPKLVELAKKHGKSPAQVLLRYQVQRGVIAIPKSVHKERLAQNINIFDFNLSDEDMKLVDSFDCNGRVCHLNWVNDHPHFPFHIEF
ncbi:aldo-keto reductase family 1 member B1-like isoform X1 [Artemia franciscana]